MRADSSGQLKELVFPRALDLDRPKRARTMFSSEQLRRLEEEFHRNQYLVGVERAELASQLGLSETQVIDYYTDIFALNYFFRFVTVFVIVVMFVFKKTVCIF